MHKYELLVLELLKKHGELSFNDLEKRSELGKDKLLWAIENLSNLSLLELEYEKNKEVILSLEGTKYAKHMLPEDELLKDLQSGREMKASDLQQEKDKIALQWCIKKGFLNVIDKRLILTKKGETQKVPTEASSFIALLFEKGYSDESLSKSERELLDEFVLRSLIEVREKNTLRLVKISEQGLRSEYTKDEELIDELTRDTILKQTWNSKNFKSYDVTTPVQQEIIAMRHPLRLLLNDVKNVFSRMGFTEISGPIVEPSFWVFDSLFVPQDHPAREAQDTFHLSNPTKLPVLDKEHIKTIKKSHTKSWKIKWSEEEAESAVLRTQMTSVSVHYIREFMKRFMAGEELELPRKFFTVGRVFRNENLDYKHLTDFYQCDGIIIGKNLTMANLFDTLSKFYGSFGVKTRFKPAYFPFVEPGAEIFTQMGENGEWLEVGGSGIIRREVTGIDRKKISVLAWGLGIERMLLINNKNINSVIEPYNCNIGWLRNRKLR